MKLRFLNFFLIQSFFVFFALQVQATALPKTLTQEQLTGLGNFNETRIHAADPAGYSLFGNAVAVDGNRAIVGASHAAGTGLAYVFEFDGTVWQQTAELTPDIPPADGADVGYSVAISGDTAVVGAPGTVNWTTGWGNVYVYRYNGAQWKHETTLTHNEVVYAERMGYSVAIEGSTIVVGATDRYLPYESSGSAHVFEFVGTGWQRTAVLKPDNSNIYQLFGHAVAIEGKRVLIGSSRDYGGATQYGAVYVFEHDGLQWKKAAKLTVSDRDPGSTGYFGSRLALKGNLALIGAPEADEVEYRSGTAYIFRNLNGTWVQEARLRANDADGWAHFGSCVALSDDVAIVGAYGASNESDHNGAVYLYGREQHTWTEQIRLTAVDAPDYGIEFGHSCALQDNRMVVGAPYYPSYSGAAFIYNLSAH